MDVLGRRLSSREKVKKPTDKAAHHDTIYGLVNGVIKYMDERIDGVSGVALRGRWCNNRAAPFNCDLIENCDKSVHWISRKRQAVCKP